MKTTILSLPQPNWSGLVHFCKDSGLPDPLRQLSDRQSPLALPSVLDFNYDPISNIGGGHDYNDSMKHCFMSALISVDEQDTIIRLLSVGFTQSTLIQKRILLVSSSYQHWYEIITKNLIGGISEFHAVLSSICLQLEVMGFRKLFDKPRKLQSGILIYDKTNTQRQSL